MFSDDVKFSGSGSASSPSGVFDRTRQERTERIEAVHVPTGMKARIEYGPACMSKSKWKSKKQEMRDWLLIELQSKISKRKHHV